MEFFFADQNVERRPPAETRFLDLHAAPDAEGYRVRVTMELTPFEKRPYIEISLTDSAGLEVASASIVEPAAWKLELTLHIRKVDPTGGKAASGVKMNETVAKTEPLTLRAALSYPGLGEIDHRAITVPLQKQ